MLAAQHLRRPGEVMVVVGQNERTGVCYLFCWFSWKRLRRAAGVKSAEIPIMGGKCQNLYQVVNGIIGCEYKKSSWHLIGIPDGSNTDRVNSITMSGRDPPL